jgi:hypothetical protein
LARNNKLCTLLFGGNSLFFYLYCKDVLIGIDEMGVEVEHPFPLLPLQELAAAMQHDVATEIQGIEHLPPFPVYQF